MSIKYGKLRGKILGIFVVVLLVGILSIFNSIAATPTNETEPVTEDAWEVSVETRGSRASNLKFNGYLELWDSNYGQPHDGIYGDTGDSYRFYLDSEYGFSIVLKNIYQEGYIDDINTILKRGSGVGSVITVTQPYYNRTYPLSSGYTSTFYYQIKIGTNARITNFELILDADFAVVDDQNDRVNRSGSIYFKIQLSSRIKSYNSGDKIVLEAQNRYDSQVPLYSGAKNQLIVLPDPYSASSTLEDVSLVLHLPSSFTLDFTTVTADELSTSYYYNEDFEWLLRDAGSIYSIPQEIHGSYDVTYTRYDNKVTEKTAPIIIEIDDTPVVYLDNQIEESDIGSTASGKFLSNFEFYQGSSSQTFSLKMKNEGNIDLKGVEVELFTDNAAFFFKSKFYYDEDDYAYKRSYGKTIDMGDIAVGQSVTKEFSTEIIKNLPPGLYRIPIKYTANYNLGGLMDVDLDVEDFHENIVATRSTDNKGFTPFLLINVMEGDNANDVSEPDLQAISTASLKPGMHNVLLPVELTNLENYRLINVNAKIKAGEGSPLQRLNVVDRTVTEIDSQEKEFTMYGANDAFFSNKNTIHFMVDVYLDAAPGNQEVPITITCLDPFNQERTTIVKVPININPIPPCFLISDASATAIEPNKKFTLTIQAYNSGGSDAKKVRLLFNGSSNLFSSDEGIQGPKTIKKNEIGEFTYEIKANDIEPGKTYTCTVFVSFEDSMGNLYSFDSNPQQKITLRSEEPEPEGFVFETTHALVVLGIFILISAIVISYFRARTAKKMGAQVAGPDERVPPPGTGVQGAPGKPQKGRFGRKRKDGQVVEMDRGAPPPSQDYVPPPQQPPTPQSRKPMPPQTRYPPTQGPGPEPDWQRQQPSGPPPRGPGPGGPMGPPPMQGPAPGPRPTGPYQPPRQQQQQDLYY
jgi:hypothetical protein